MPRHIKLINENEVCKKLEYPKNYEQLLKYASDFVLLTDNNKKLELREGTEGRRILDKEDFDLMTKDLNNQDCIKIRIKIIDKIEKNNNIVIFFYTGRIILFIFIVRTNSSFTMA